GMFGLAVWDDRRCRLVLARDRAGEKPLFWTEVAGELRFASEVQALLVFPDQPRRVNPAAAALYAALGYVPAPLTMIAGISKLPPAHHLVADRSGITLQRYWDAAAAAAAPSRSGRSTSSRARWPSRWVIPPSCPPFSWPRRRASTSRWCSRAKARTSCSGAIRPTSGTRPPGCTAGFPDGRRSPDS